MKKDHDSGGRSARIQGLAFRRSLACALVLLAVGHHPARAALPRSANFIGDGAEDAPKFLGEGWIVSRGKSGANFLEPAGRLLRISGSESTLRRTRSLEADVVVRKLNRGDLVASLRSHRDADAGREWVFARVYGFRDFSGRSVQKDDPPTGWLVLKGEATYAREWQDPWPEYLEAEPGDPNGRVQAPPGQCLRITGEGGQLTYYFKTRGDGPSGWSKIPVRKATNEDEIDLPEQSALAGLRASLWEETALRPYLFGYEVLTGSLNVREDPKPDGGIVFPVGKGSVMLATGRTVEGDGRTWAEVFLPPKRAAIPVADRTEWGIPQFASRHVTEEGFGDVPYVPEDHPFRRSHVFASLLHGSELGPQVRAVVERIARVDEERISFHFRLSPRFTNRITEDRWDIVNNIPARDECELVWVHRGRPLPLRKGDWVDLVVDAHGGNILCVYSGGWQVNHWRSGLEELIEVVADDGEPERNIWLVPDKISAVAGWDDYHIWLYEDFGIVMNSGIDGAGGALESSRIVAEFEEEEPRFANEVNLFRLDPRLKRGGWKSREDAGSRAVVPPQQSTREPG